MKLWSHSPDPFAVSPVQSLRSLSLSWPVGGPKDKMLSALVHVLGPVGSADPSCTWAGPPCSRWDYTFLSQSLLLLCQSSHKIQRLCLLYCSGGLLLSSTAVRMPVSCWGLTARAWFLPLLCGLTAFCLLKQEASVFLAQRPEGSALLWWKSGLFSASLK